MQMSAVSPQFRDGLLQFALACILATFALPAAAEVTYLLHDLGTFGGRYAAAKDVNSHGVIVGDYYPAGPFDTYAFYWDGEFHDLGPGSASAINDAGVIVGTSGGQAVSWNGGIRLTHGAGEAMDINNNGDIIGHDGDNPWLLPTGGSRVQLSGLGGENTAALGLNDNGLVVGYGDLPAYPRTTHAIVWVNGQPMDLGTFGGTYSYCSGVNNKGVVVGMAAASDPEHLYDIYHIFLWDGELHDLGLGSPSSINDNGVIAGRDGPFPFGAWAYDGVAFSALPALGVNTVPRSLNASGVIVGYSTTPEGEQHAVYWTPVPEPSTAAAMGALIAAMAVSQSRRRRIR